MPRKSEVQLTPSNLPTPFYHNSATRQICVWRQPNPLQPTDQACKLMGDVKSTGLGRDRLRSVDRNNKTTLLLTRRCGTNKSYAKDLSPRMVKLQDVSQSPGLPPGPNYQPARIQGQRPIRIQLRCVGENHRFLAWILTQRRSAIIQQMVASRHCLVRQPQKPII